MQPQGSWGCARGEAPGVLLEHDQQLLRRVHLAEPKASAVVLAWTLHTSGESNEHCKGSLLPSQGVIRRRQGCWRIASGEAPGWVVILVGNPPTSSHTLDMPLWPSILAHKCGPRG